MEREAAHQGFDPSAGLALGKAGEVGVAGGGENAVMAQNLLYFKQIDTRFNQVRGIAVAQAVRRDLFFSPQSCATRCRVFCTPPRSRGVRALCAPARPPARLGNSNSGLRWVCQNRRNTSRVISGKGTNRSRLPLESRMCTRWRSASMSPTFNAKPSLRRRPMLYRVKKNTR